MTTPADYEVVAHNLATDSENRIHDDDVARQLGFGGGLVPGVELFAYVSHPFVDAWGTDFLRRGGLDVRFRRPVYDGEQVRVVAAPAGDGGFEAVLKGPDGNDRALGGARPQAPATPLRHAYLRVPAPPSLHPTGPGPLPLGPLGSVTEQVTADGHATYLAGIGDQHPVFDGTVVHPGALLRMVNALLMGNVALGPWIHTASKARFLGVAPVPTTLHCHGVVTECFERNDNAYVRYDALVLSGDEPVLEVEHEAIYRLAAVAA